MCGIVHAADIQDRDGGVLLMSALFGLFPFLLTLFADSGYQGEKFQKGLRRVCGQINVEIVKRSDVGKFVVLPKRWIVEERSRGSTAAGAWPKIGSASIVAASPFYAGPPSGSCCESFAGKDDDLG